MQNTTAIRVRSKSAATPSRELSWSFMLLVIVCACVVAAGFFFAARQHFTSLDYGIKNSKLREQLQNLETEKRRLLLAREVALSPVAIRKAANSVGLRQSEFAAVQASNKDSVAKSQAGIPTLTRISAGRTPDTNGVVKTVMSVPAAHAKSAGEVRNRVVDAGKDKKDKTEVAALLKPR